jgi:hypothetical protein
MTMVWKTDDPEKITSQVTSLLQQSADSVKKTFSPGQGRRRIAGRRKPPVKAHTDLLPPWWGGGFAPPGLMKDGMGYRVRGLSPG